MTQAEHPTAEHPTAGQPPASQPPLTEPPVGRPPGRRRGTLWLAAVVAAVIGAAAGAGSYAAFDRDHGSSASITVSPGSGPTASSASGVTVPAAVISPSVVTISVAGQSGAGTGSGVIIRPDGYILTNDHVVTLDSSSAGGDKVTVTRQDGTAEPATVVGTDPADDLAVVRIGTRSGLAVASFASSGDLKVGQGVVAVGAPLGLSETVTSGIVSALDRPVQAGSTGQAIFNAIQTDAAINPGNSGGPLADLAGRVIGINSAIASTSSGGSGQSGNIGIGFAIPSDQAVRIAGQLISTGKATHAVIGATVQAAPSSGTGGPTSAAGATISAVTTGGPADKAGVKAGDVITRVGDQRIDDSTGLIAAVRSHPPGSTVEVTVSRGGSSRTVPVKLGESSAG